MSEIEVAALETGGGCRNVVGVVRREEDAICERGKLINTGTAGRHDSLSREDALSIQGSNEDKYEMSRGQTFLVENR